MKRHPVRVYKRLSSLNTYQASPSPANTITKNSPDAKPQGVGRKLKTVNDLMPSRKTKPLAAPPPANEDSGEDEKLAEEDDEDLLVSDAEESKAAVKIAQLALSRTVDVDVDGGWKDGDPCAPYISLPRILIAKAITRVPYASLAHVFGMIEATSKRLEITTLLTSFLLLVIKRSKPGDVDSLRHAVYLSINRVSQYCCLDVS